MAPQAIGAVVLAELGFTALAASATATAIVGNVIILGAALTLQLLMRRDAEQAGLPPPQIGRQTQRSAVQSRIAGFGRARYGGAYMLFEEREEHSWDVIALCEGPIVGFVDYYLHGDRVGLDGSGWVDEVLSSSMGAKNDGRYQAQTIRIQTRTGQTPSTSEATFIGGLPDLWTTSHRGDGIACAYMLCKDVIREQFESRYPNGLPQLSIVLDALRCWDPRIEAQDPDDELTWALSANPVLQMLRYITDAHIGMGHDRETVIMPVIERWKAEATLAETEGYASNGFYKLDTDPSEVLAMMLATCDGWLAEDGEGRLVPVVGSYREPTFILTDDDVIGFAFRFGQDDEAAVNELKFTYTSPDHDYNEVAGDPWIDEDDQARRGFIRSQTLALTWVQDHTQARKLAKRAMARLNATARGTVTTTLYGLGALGHRWIGLQQTSLPVFSNAVLEVENIEVDLAAGAVRISWVVVDGETLTEFDDETEGGEAPPTPPAAGESLMVGDNLDPLLDDAGQQLLQDA